MAKFSGSGIRPHNDYSQFDTAAQLSVLIYGSHRLAMEGLKHLIEDSGVRVVSETLDSEVLMREVRNLSIDVVIFDLYHRTESDFGLASSIRRVSKQTQIFFLIDEPTVDELRLAIRHGVLGFFGKKSPKPLPLPDMLRMVANGEALIESRLLARFLQSLGLEDGGATQVERDIVSKLSDLDREILARTVSGDISRQIAADCGFSAGFIRNRLSAIYRAIGVTNKSQAVIFAVRAGITNW